MSNYRSSFSGYGGRASPYASRPEPDRSFSDLFEYVAPGHDGGPSRSTGDIGRDYRTSTNSVPFEDDNAPDIIHVLARHIDESFHLEFPPFSISESGVLVSDVRERVAQRLGHDPRRIRLVYKDQDLRRDRHPVKKYGCKQNSEILVVVTQHLNDWNAEGHSSEDDSGSAVSSSHNARRQTQTRPRGLSSVRHRSNEFEMVPESSTYLSPNGYTPQPRDGRGHREERDPRRSPMPSQRTRSRSPAPPSPPAPTATSAAPPSPKMPPKSPPKLPSDPTTPMGKVQTLNYEFQTKWVPEATRFMRSRSSDAVARDKEYRVLSESIMRHVVEAADLIELQGDQDARAERKKVLNEAQDLLKQLDANNRT